MRFREGVTETGLSEELKRGLRFAEMFARRELVVTSGLREGDERCHGRGEAVDFACSDSEDRYRLVKGLYQAGFERIGLYTRHIHADVCLAGYPQQKLWLGGASK